MSIKTVAIEWTGPYSYDEIIEQEYENGVYLLTGSRKGPTKYGILYVGITGRKFSARLSKAEHDEIDKSITKNTRQYWIGKSSFLRRSRGKTKSVTFEDVDHLIIRYLCKNFGENSLINKRKKKSNPPNSVGIINIWKFPSNMTQRQREKHVAQQNLANIILFDKSSETYYGVKKKNFKFDGDY